MCAAIPKRRSLLFWVVRVLAIPALSICAVRTANAHPHVWVEAAIDVVYDETRTVVMLRQAWTFDEVFTAYAMSGLNKSDPSGLNALASRYLKSFEENGFFVEVESHAAFGQARATAHVGENNRLTVDIDLPLRTSQQHSAFEFRVYDRNYFVDISFPDAGSVKLLGAPAGCNAELSSPKKRETVDEAFFNALRGDENWARQFATTIRIACP